MFLITLIDKAKQTLPKKIIFPDCYYIEYRTVYNESKQISLYILNDGKLFHENFKVEFTHKSFVLLNYNSNAENVSVLLQKLDKNHRFFDLLNNIETNNYFIHCNVIETAAKILKGPTCALPLYYCAHTCEESFCVGTNPLHVSSILQPLEINYDFLARYIFGRYDDVSGRPETALKNVFYLLPRDVYA